MTKYILFFSVACIISHAIDIQITNNLHKVTLDEAETLFFQYKIAGVTISESDAKRIAEENRILAHAFLQDNPFPAETKRALIMKVEKELASLYIKESQISDELNDDILLSYYKQNKNEYFIGQIVDFEDYQFDNFERATEFYNLVKQRKDERSKMAEDLNITTNHTSIALKFFPYEFKIHLQDTNETEYFTAPQLFKNKYSVLYINRINQDDQFIPYGKVKDDIRKKLYKQTFLRYRENALRAIEKK